MSALVQIMACHLVGGMPLSKPHIYHFWLDLGNTFKWKLKCLKELNILQRIYPRQLGMALKVCNSTCCNLWPKYTSVDCRNIAWCNGLASAPHQVIFRISAAKLLSIWTPETNFKILITITYQITLEIQFEPCHIWSQAIPLSPLFIYYLGSYVNGLG